MRVFAGLLMLAVSVFGAENVSTFSIVAWDPATQEWGVAVASRYFSVGSVVPWAEAGVGAVATQANVNVGYGPKGLELLKQGLTASQVIEKLLAEDTFEGKDGRQVGVVDSKGNVAAYTGPAAPKWCGDRQGKTWTAQGNILVGPQVVDSVGRVFEATKGDFAERLYAALKAGDDAGGDARGRQSASMLVVKKGGGRNFNNDREIYINVDDNPKPFEELRRLLDINQGYIYQEKTTRLIGENKLAEARDAATKYSGYMPKQAGAQMTLGMLDYAAGDKPAALTAFREAKNLSANPENFRRQLEGSAKRQQRFTGILDDKEFMKSLFPEN